MSGLLALPAPYYSEPGATVYQTKAQRIAHLFERDSFDHLFVDPPYSEHTQKNVKTTAKAKRTKREAGGADVGNVELKFAPLSPGLRWCIAETAARVATGYSLIFTDEAGYPGWKKDILRAGLELVRCCYWIRHAAPQTTGDRPAAGAEMILAVHRPGKKVWNGGGKDGIYPYPIVKGSAAEPRRHETQKPLALMLALVADFSQPGARILDCCAGSGTTLEAAKRLGRLSVGISDRRVDVEHCRDRLRQETIGGLDFAATAPAPIVAVAMPSGGSGARKRRDDSQSALALAFDEKSALRHPIMGARSSRHGASDHGWRCVS